MLDTPLDEHCPEPTSRARKRLCGNDFKGKGKGEANRREDRTTSKPSLWYHVTLISKGMK